MAGTKLFLSVLNHLAASAKQKMSPAEWDAFLKPGRTLKRPGNVNLPLRQDELDFGPWARVRSEMEEGQKYAPNDVAAKLEQYWQEHPPITFEEHSNARDMVNQDTRALVKRLRAKGEVTQLGGELSGYVHGYESLEHYMGPYAHNLSPESIQELNKLRERYEAARDDESPRYPSHVLPHTSDMAERLPYNEILTLLPSSMNHFSPASHFDDQANLGSWTRLDARPVAGPKEPDPVPPPAGANPSEFYRGHPMATVNQEFQSDLHQMGRDRGYRVPGPVVDWGEVAQQKIREIAARVPQDTELVDIINMYNHQHGRDRWHIRDDTTPEMAREWAERILDYVPSDELNYQHTDPAVNTLFADLANAHRQHAESRDYRNRAMPDTPFKGDLWMELEFRKALAHAVENDHDYLTWTTGQHQIDRWAPRFVRKADQLDWIRHEDGTVDVMPDPPQSESRGGYKKERTDKLNPLDLYHLLGEELSQKIIKDPMQTGTIYPDRANNPNPGREPQVYYGGTGMRVNYDTKESGIARRYLNMYGEKNPTIEKVRVLGGPDKKMLRDTYPLRMGHPGDYEIEELRDAGVGSGVDQPEHPLNQHYLDILNAHERYTDAGHNLRRLRELDQNAYGDLEAQRALESPIDDARNRLNDLAEAYQEKRKALDNAVNAMSEPHHVWGVKLSPELKDRIRKAGLQYFSALPLAGYGVSQGMDQGQGPGPSPAPDDNTWVMDNLAGGN